MKQRPSTAGCTELSCMYHGGDNRFKRAHAQMCPIFQFDGHVFTLIDAEAGEPPAPVCDCDQGRGKRFG